MDGCRFKSCKAHQITTVKLLAEVRIGGTVFCQSGAEAEETGVCPQFSQFSILNVLAQGRAACGASRWSDGLGGVVQAQLPLGKGAVACRRFGKTDNSLVFG